MKQLTIVSAGTGNPSTTRMLANRAGQAVVEAFGEEQISVSGIELGPLAVDIAKATVTGFPGERLQADIERLAAADGVIAATPVYKAGLSGLFKSFFDVLDSDLLVAKPVLLVATAGTARHSLVADEQMRPLFAYMRALTLPTSLFAAPEDWSSPGLTDRIRRAATEMAVFLEADVGEEVAERGWYGYQHEFAGNAARAARTVDDVDFESPLMRLAAGGSAGSNGSAG
jgi:FMN reductase